METKILEILKDSDKALNVHEIEHDLGLNTVDELKELLKELNRLEDELKIYRTNKDNYMLFNNSHLKVGKMIGNRKGFGFVDIEGDEDVFIAPPNINNAIHGDTVIVEITSKKGLDLEGRIVKIVDRKLKEMVGEVYYKKNIAYIDLDDDKVKVNVQVDKDKTMGAMSGHKVLVKITNKLQNNDYRGEIVKILGHKNDPGVDILSITNKFGINDVFSDEVMAEVNNIPDFVSQEEMSNRRDLRNETIFTIDGDDTKDIDDAISIKKLPNDCYQLGVHIADVSYYVRPDTKLDEEAFERGTSVYLADRVIPMLPHKLSNGICSLNPNCDRLTISCVMTIDENGNIIDHDIFESVINSKKQMTYKCVNEVLEKNNIPEGYEPFVDDLKIMGSLAKILRNNKIGRGYIDFDIDEAKIIVNEEGKAIDVVLRERGTGERLIEDFMIAANETVANHIYYMELPFVYRIHGTPNEQKIINFLNFIGILGYQITGDFKEITPNKMQKLLEQLKEKKEFPILSRLLLRSMQKAVYDSNNIGHFGLGSKCYTHFTSPIRRYPDTTVHRLLRTYLFDGKINNETVDYWEKKLPILTEHCSTKEQDSVECEREVDDMKKAEYMLNHIDEKYTGMVVSVMSFGMFVELPNLVEGLVRIDNLTDDHYFFDEATFSLKSESNKRGYRIGDTVNIIVKSASKEARQVDFIINKEK